MNYEAKNKATKRDALALLAQHGVSLPASIDGTVAHFAAQAVARIAADRETLMERNVTLYKALTLAEHALSDGVKCDTRKWEIAIHAARAALEGVQS